MIRIRIKGSAGNIEGFMVWGHAGYAPSGADIVCAGVSAVCTTAIIGLVALFPENTRYFISPSGFMYCRLRGKMTKARARDARLIFKVMFLGLEAIRESHGEYLDLIKGG